MAVIEDFEDPGSPSWTVSTDVGATATLSKTIGYKSDNALSVKYSFPSQAARFATISKTLATPAQATAIALRVKSPPDVVLQLKVTMQTGAPYQTWFSRPVESALNPSGWYLNVVQLPAPSKITAISIIAEGAYDFPCQGEFIVDEIDALEDLNVSHTLATRSPHVTPALPGSEIFGDRLGVSWHADHGISGTADKLRDAGFGFVRMDLRWDWVESETEVKFDFAWYDNVFNGMQLRGIGALFILGYGHKRYDLKTQAGIDGYGRYCEETARHYAGKGVRYELFNEPDLNWGGTQAEYAAFYQAGIAGVRRGDPQAQVSNGGLSWFNWPQLKSSLQSGGVKGAAAMAVHGYRNDRPETVVDSVIALSWVQRRFNERKRPIWMTEWGYSNSTIGLTPRSSEYYQKQAALYARMVLTQWMLNLPVIVLYDAKDDGTNAADEQHNFGLLDTAGNPKANYVAIKRLMSAAKSRELIGMVSDTPYGLHIAKLGGADDTCFILWVSERNVVATITATTAGVIDYFGPTPSPKGSAMQVTLRDTDQPVYLTYKGIR